MVADVSAYAILIVTAATLLYVAVNDLRRYQIRNEHVVLLAGLFALYAWVSGLWVTAHWHVALALLMFVLMLIPYVWGWLGGGDLKLLTVAFLWTGPDCALLFAIVLALGSLAHAALTAWGIGGFVRDGRKRLAFAPAVALGMIAVFVSGCLRPIG